MTTTEGATPDDTTTERHTWTYKGRRWHSRERKLFYAWQDEQGEERWYAKLRGGVIGGAYFVTTDGESIYLNPEYVGGSEHGDPERVKWCAESRAAVAASEAAATERRLAKEGDDLAAVLAPVRAMYARTVGSGRRAALLAAVIQAVTG